MMTVLINAEIPVFHRAFDLDTLVSSVFLTLWVIEANRFED